MRIKMLSEATFFEGLQELFLRRKIVNISGESGTGKTNFALYMIGNLLNDENSCIWVQASELFPSKRLRQMFGDFPEKLEHIEENVFVIPKKKIISSYPEQARIFRQLVDPTAILPPSLRYIVIDNISHHLRLELTKYSEISKVSSILNDFYDSCLFPLILNCNKNDTILILLHEVTFDPKIEINRPFFYKLYDRIRAIDITLSNRYQSLEKKMTIKFEQFRWDLNYAICNRGMTML